LVLGQAREQSLIGQHTDGHVAVLYGELFEACLTDLLKSFLAGGLHTHEMSLVEGQIAHGHVLAPVLVGDQVGHVRVRALLLGHVATLVHPVSVQMLGHVVADVVGEHNDDALALGDLIFLDVLQSAVHGLARAATAHETLLGEQSARHNKALLVGALLPIVDDGLVIDTRVEVVSSALDDLAARSSRHLLIGGRQDRAGRVNANDLDVGVELSQLSRNASDSTTSAHSQNNVVNLALAAALVENLLASLVIVSQWVARVLVLVQDQGILASLLHGLLHDEGRTHVAVRVIFAKLCWRAHNSST